MLIFIDDKAKCFKVIKTKFVMKKKRKFWDNHVNIIR